MSKNRVWITTGCCFFALAISVWAQVRKAGLWEMTSTQTWQQSPLPPSAPSGANSPFAGGTHTTQLCLTQQQIDKYGAIVPQMPGCQVTNIVQTANGMTANLECTGRISGKGTMESSAIDAEHSKGKIHFAGSIQAGPNNRPIEWTIESSAVFKSADCGNVKPPATPEK